MWKRIQSWLGAAPEPLHAADDPAPFRTALQRYPAHAPPHPGYARDVSTMQMTTHRGAHWQIDLPSDWTLRKDDEGVAYFEAADGSAGLYIAVWDTHITDQPVAEVLDQFVAGSVEGQDKVPGCSWTRQTVRLEEGDWILDAVCAEKSHRIFTRYIAALPRVLSAAFHDYQFSSVPESTARIAPSLESMWLLHDQ